MDPPTSSKSTLYIEKYIEPITTDKLSKHFDGIEHVHIGKGSDWAFVTFGSREQADLALEKYKYPKLTMECDLKNFINTESKYKGYRVMSKSKWDRKTIEYFQLQRSMQISLSLMKSSGSRKAIYTSAVVCKFMNIYPTATQKTVKRLFEMVAPVSFIDFDIDNLHHVCPH